MRRADLMHIVHAAASVSGETEIVVIGSQSILGSHPDPPESMLRSMEADVFPLRAPEKADDIDGALGDGSHFHGSFGYYAHGVGPETARAPSGWLGRLVAVPVPRRVASEIEAVALCLEPHDLILANLQRTEFVTGSSRRSRLAPACWTSRCCAVGSRTYPSIIDCSMTSLPVSKAR